jgi:SAM-dependent methyltransferase
MTGTVSQYCPVCSFPGMDFFFEMEDVPVFCNVLYASAEAARAAERGTITLGMCRQCTHVFNFTFEPSRVAYTPAYENSLHFSPHFHRYAEGLARELIERYGIRNKTVLDIGCGKGDFLKLMVALGNNRGIGFDASYRADDAVHDERLTFIQDFYSTAYVHHHADLYTCRHVLEHLPNPSRLLQDVHASLQNNPAGILYIEVPNALWTLEQGGIWDVIYEHCSYFTPSSLRRLMEECGFDVLRMYDSFGGQYLAAECTLRHATSQPLGQPQADIHHLASLAQAFSERHLSNVKAWKDTLIRLREEGKRIVVWGSGSKGVTFLNLVSGKEHIECVVDVNPRKHNLYTPCTAHHVVAPEDLGHIQPDVVIVMNPVYADEIRSTLAGLGLEPQILFA